MARRRLVCAGGPRRGLLLLAGLSGPHRAPCPVAGDAAVAREVRARLTARPRPRAKRQPRPRRSAKPAAGDLARGVHITADDPGLQLLAARNEAGRESRLDAQVQWTRRARRVWPRSSRAAISGPLGPGVVTVKAALEGQTATARITLEPGSARRGISARTSCRS